MNVIYHPEAEEEMIATVSYYENQADGLGIKFLDDLDQTVEEIVKCPETWITLGENLKRHQFTHFPFAILYQIIDSKIRILAVMNLHKEPNYWKTRI
jgi:hypothetical protein